MEIKAWERRKGEPAKWFDMFLVYLRLGTDRAFSSVVRDKFPYVSIQRNATKWDWKARADAWDNEERCEATRKYEADRLEDRRIRLKTLKAIRGKLLKGLKDVDVSAMKPKDIFSALATNADEFRTELGDQPSQRITIQAGITLTMDDFAEAKHVKAREELDAWTAERNGPGSPEAVIDGLTPPEE